METNKNEPVSPTGRLFVHPKFDLIINCALGFKNPLDTEAMKSDFANTLIVKHPRFNSLLVVDKHGREFWRRTKINLDDHLFIHQENSASEPYSEEEQEEKINAILADYAVSSPLSTEKPLWELHIHSDLKCMIFRLHHALGDGISMLSLFLATFKRPDAKNDADAGNVSEKKSGNRGERKRRENVLIGMMKMIWWTPVFVVEFFGRSFCVRDQKTVISGGDGVELWPRMAATAKFSLQDMKIVKKAIAHATINDVLFGVLSYGFSKYLKSQSSHALQEGLQITGLAMVNLRKRPGLQELSKLMENDSEARWGNKFAYMILPLYYRTTYADPLEYVKRAKVMIDRKKQSLVAHFAYFLAKSTMFFFGPKVTHMINHKILSNTTFMISNAMGPQEECTFADNPMTYIRATTSSLPQAVSLHMVSYAGIVDMQIMVAKEIIPDPRFLAKCFEDALREMKDAANPAFNDIC